LQGFSSEILQRKRRFSPEKRKVTAVTDKTKFCYVLKLLYHYKVDLSIISHKKIFTVFTSGFYPTEKNLRFLSILHLWNLKILNFYTIKQTLVYPECLFCLTS